MEFYIGPQFSKEFSFEESRIVKILEDEINTFFKDNDYGERVKMIVTGVICVSKGFEPFFMTRPPKVLRKEPTLEFEIKLDFDYFKAMDEPDRKKSIVKEYFKSLKEFLESKTIKGFEKEKFLEDLESFFKEQGYLD